MSSCNSLILHLLPDFGKPWLREIFQFYAGRVISTENLLLLPPLLVFNAIINICMIQYWAQTFIILIKNIAKWWWVNLFHLHSISEKLNLTHMHERLYPCFYFYPGQLYQLTNVRVSQVARQHIRSGTGLSPVLHHLNNVGQIAILRNLWYDKT